MVVSVFWWVFGWLLVFSGVLGLFIFGGFCMHSMLVVFRWVLYLCSVHGA